MKRTQTFQQTANEYESCLGGEGSNGTSVQRRESVFQAWNRFWFSPTDPLNLHVVRVLAGLLFLAWLSAAAGQFDSIFGLNGWFDRQAFREAARLEGGPPKPITWSLAYVCTASWQLQTLYWASIAVLVLFTLGFFTRVTGVLTWVAIASFTASPLLEADLDPFLLILSFYLMVGYLLLGQWNLKASWSERLLGGMPGWIRRAWWEPARPSVGANVALRLLQVHFALVVVTNGLHKLQFGDWWAGTSFWYPLYAFATLDQARRYVSSAELFMSVLNIGAYAALFWQICFPLFAWSSRWRWLLVGGAFIGLVINTWLYELPLFAVAVLIGCLSYVTDWRWLGAKVGGLLQRRQAEEKLVVKSVPVTAGSN